MPDGTHENELAILGIGVLDGAADKRHALAAAQRRHVLEHLEADAPQHRLVEAALVQRNDDEEGPVEQRLDDAVEASVRRAAQNELEWRLCRKSISIELVNAGHSTLTMTKASSRLKGGRYTNMSGARMLPLTFSAKYAANWSFASSTAAEVR